MWDLVTAADRGPDREIVHSHDFNRYLTPFRAEWDPKDPSERLVVIGRWPLDHPGFEALRALGLLPRSTSKGSAQRPVGL